MTASSHGALPPQTARILAHLPERVRISWPHHQLCGAELVVHSWQRIDGDIHLRLTLADGSVGCLPAAWTDLFEPAPEGQPQHAISLAAVRSLRALVQALSARHAAGELGTSSCPSA